MNTSQTNPNCERNVKIEKHIWRARSNILVVNDIQEWRYFSYQMNILPNDLLINQLNVIY